MIDNVTMKHALTPGALAGGTSNSTFSVSGLRRAKTDAAPRVKPNEDRLGDEVLTRGHHRGARRLDALARLHEAARAPVLAKAPPLERHHPLPPAGLVRAMAEGRGRGEAAHAPVAPKPTEAEHRPLEPAGLARTTEERDIGEIARRHPQPPEALARLIERRPPSAAPSPGQAATGRLTREAQRLRGALDRLRARAGAGEDLQNSERTRHEASLVAEQLTIKSDVDKALNELSGLLLTARAEAGNAGHLAELEALRRTLVGAAIAAEMPSLSSVARGLSSAPTGAIMSALWTLHGPAETSAEPEFPTEDIQDIGRLLRGLGAQHEGEGGPVHLRALRARLVDHLLESAGRVQDEAAGTRLAEAIEAFLPHLDARIAMDEAIGAVIALMDSPAAVQHPPQPFPLGGAMRAIVCGLPFLRAQGSSAAPDKLGNAAECITALCDTIERGEPPAVLQGHDPAFDKTLLLFRAKAASEMAVEALRARADAAGTPLPSDRAIALSKRPDEALTVAERVILLDAVGQRGATLEQARDLCRRAEEDIARARTQGRAAAALRHELTASNAKLATVLTPHRMFDFRPGIPHADRIFPSAPQAIRKDEALLQALVKFGGKTCVADAAILLAAVSKLEFETLKAEHNVLGLHGKLALTAIAPDPDRPLAHVGITNDALVQLGLDPRDLDRVGKAVDQLNRQGVASVAEVEAVTKSINAVSALVLKSSLTQDAIQSFEGQRVRALGQHLADALLGQAMREAGDGAAGASRPTKTSDAVTSFFKKRVETLTAELDEKAAWGELDELASDYTATAKEIGALYGQRRDLRRQMDDARARLQGDADAGSFIGHVDTPRGLASAQRILVALNESLPLDERLEAAQELKGFDPLRMHTPWFPSSTAFRDAPTLADLAKIEGLKEKAEAIVFLRKEGPERLEVNSRTLAGDGARLDSVLADRRGTAGKGMQGVVDMIRAAVLVEWAGVKSDGSFKKGELVDDLDPSAPGMRKTIEDTLTTWGLDVERFAPEIEDVLTSRMTADDLLQWAQEADWSSATIEAHRRERQQALSFAPLKQVREHFVPDVQRPIVTGPVKRALISMLEAFQEGDKLDLKAGPRLAFDTGKIPLDPSAIVGIRGRLALALMGQFEIERGSDGFKLHLRTGIEEKASADVVAGKKFKLVDGVELSAEATAGLEQSATRLRGVTLTFPTGPAGVNAAVEFVSKVVDGKPITFDDWGGAQDVSTTLQTHNKWTGSATATGRAQLGGKGPSIDGRQDTLGAGLVAAASATAMRRTKTTTNDSLNETTFKRDVEYTVTLGATFGVYARLFNPANIATGLAAQESGAQSQANTRFGTDQKDGKPNPDSPNYNMIDRVSNSDLVNIGINKTYTYLDKEKQVQDASGRFTKCERVRHANFRQGTIACFAVCDTPQLRAILDKPEAEKSEDERVFTDNFAAFMRLAKARDSDFIAMTSALKESERARANELMVRAAAVRGGNPKEAAELETLARQIVDTPQHYVPTKLTLVDTRVEKAERSIVNARFIRLESFTDSKSEHTGYTLAIPGPK